MTSGLVGAQEGDVGWAPCSESEEPKLVPFQEPLPVLILAARANRDLAVKTHIRAKGGEKSDSFVFVFLAGYIYSIVSWN